MTFFVIIAITIALWLIFAPYIRPWLQRRAQEKMADYIRASMGMPTDKEQRRAEKRQRQTDRRSGNRKSFWSRPDSGHNDSAATSDEIIPKEYAVDVEYTEIKTFSQTIIADDSADGSSFTVESQVSDVEYTEIKTRNGK